MTRVTQLERPLDRPAATLAPLQWARIVASAFQRAIDAFGAHVRDDVDLTALRERLVGIASEAVRPSGAGLWLRSATEPER